MSTQDRRSSSGAWYVIGAYSCVCAATQLLWLTYATITTESAHHYHVSSGAIGWLAEIFPLLYVALAIPSGSLLDRHFRPVLTGGGVLVALGGLLRLGGPSYAWAMAGQLAVALAQPIVLSAVSKLAAEQLQEQDRPAGIALGSAGSFVGMAVALILGPTLGGHGHIERLLAVEAGVGVAAALAMVIALRRPGTGAVEQAAIEGGAARQLWSMREVKGLCGLVFIGFGVFVALATWLQTLLEPAHVSETTSGLLLLGMVVAGIVGCAAIPTIADRRGGERHVLRTAVLVSCAGCLVLALGPSVGVRALALVAMGLLLLPALPIVLTAGERLAGPHAGTAGAIVWMAGNLGGLVVALLVQGLKGTPAAAFVALAVVSMAGLLLLPRLGGSFARGGAQSLVVESD